MNKTRADRAAKTLAHYYDGLYEGSAQELLVDFLTDLRHWAVARGISFDMADRLSEYHQREECR